jgi:hypothetical protein
MLTHLRVLLLEDRPRDRATRAPPAGSLSLALEPAGRLGQDESENTHQPASKLVIINAYG